MDLFQPVSLYINPELNPISFTNLRLAVIAVMKDLAPGQRERVVISGREGQLDISGITQLYEDLTPARRA